MESSRSETYVDMEDQECVINITFGKKRLDRVYEAKINLYGHPLTNAVAKLADCNMLWERLKIEYDTCTALAKQGVKGIVSILGLYHNVEAGIMVLLMEDGGTPLTRNEEKSIEKLG